MSRRNQTRRNQPRHRARGRFVIWAPGTIELPGVTMPGRERHLGVRGLRRASKGRCGCCGAQVRDCRCPASPRTRR